MDYPRTIPGLSMDYLFFENDEATPNLLKILKGKTDQKWKNRQEWSFPEVLIWLRLQAYLILVH